MEVDQTSFGKKTPTHKPKKTKKKKPKKKKKKAKFQG